MMQNFIEKLTNNLIVAAFVPSLVFCTLVIVVFQAQVSSSMTNLTSIVTAQASNVIEQG